MVRSMLVLLPWLAIAPGCVVFEIRDDIRKANQQLTDTNASLRQVNDSLAQANKLLENSDKSLTSINESMEPIRVSLRRIDDELMGFRQTIEKIDKVIPGKINPDTPASPRSSRRVKRRHKGNRRSEFAILKRLSMFAAPFSRL